MLKNYSFFCKVHVALKQVETCEGTTDSEWITPTKGSKCMESRVMEMHLCKHIEHIFS